MMGVCLHKIWFSSVPLRTSSEKIVPPLKIKQQNHQLGNVAIANAPVVLGQLLVNFVLRMRTDCLSPASDQNSDIAIRFSDPDRRYVGRLQVAMHHNCHLF